MATIIAKNLLKQKKVTSSNLKPLDKKLSNNLIKKESLTTQTVVSSSNAVPLMNKRFFNTSKNLFAMPEYATATKMYTKEEPMFCFQCEQTKDGTGCTTVGVCGKTPEVAALQDLLVYADKGISMYARRAGALGATDKEVDVFILQSLFSTLTNVNFDTARFVDYLQKAEKMILKAKTMYENACKKAGKTPEVLTGPAQWRMQTTNVDKLVEEAHSIGVKPRKVALGPDVLGLQELITYGLKGTAAYAEHAEILGKEAPEVYRMIHEVLDFLTKEDSTVEQYLATALKVGELNLKVMELLDAGATSRFGHPTPTKVLITPVKGKAILISGHDLKDLEDLLKQTEGKGINVYTHGEMLPGHGYPSLKGKYPHLVGNYGGAWQLQKIDFYNFPGPIVMTSNCIIEPKKSYKDRIYTTNVVGWPGVKHIGNHDYSEVIKQALASPGFSADEKPQKFVTTGFARNAVLGVAGKVVEAVKAGQLKHFFLIGGCDGAEGERNYFKEVALNTPNDTMILTLACGKYRFNKHEFGTVAGLPRLLDVGQCNDAYSAIQIAAALANAFGTDVNGLPLSLVISWFEQKAVAVLLTLLHLGIKNIYLGPNLPAFCTPTMLQILNQTFGLRQISDPKKDLADMMAKKIN